MRCLTDTNYFSSLSNQRPYPTGRLQLKAEGYQSRLYDVADFYLKYNRNKQVLTNCFLRSRVQQSNYQVEGV